MSIRRWNKLAFLHKIEAVYGADIVPAPADAIVASNITFTPLQAEEEMRDLLLPYMGNQGAILTGEHGKIEFDVEIAGAGAAGDVPKYGSLLRVCGLAETITAGTDVTYSIVEDDVESGSIYFNSDGVQHIFVGAQANVQPGFTAKKIPKFRFSLTGLLGTVTDVALPTVSKAGWITPVVVSKANTSMTLHGWPAVAQSLSLNLGNVLTPRFQIGAEDIQITDRKSTGTAVVEAKKLATVDWFGIARARTQDALTLQHGTAPGNIVEISAPAVEIGTPSQGQENNIVNYSLPLGLCPVAGLDELTITVR